jgi:hypothetical protein
MLTDIFLTVKHLNKIDNTNDWALIGSCFLGSNKFAIDWYFGATIADVVDLFKTFLFRIVI